MPETTDQIVFTVKGNDSESKLRGPLTTGVSLPQNAVKEVTNLYLNHEGNDLIAQFRPLSFWPDGSIQWVLIDFEGRTGDRVIVGWGDEKSQKKHDQEISLIKTDEHYEICTGVMRAKINRRKFSLIQAVELGTRSKNGSFVSEINIFQKDLCDSWVRIEESYQDGSTTRRLYGMGGCCFASLARDEYAVDVEETGPLRTVLCLRGAYEADIGMHHYSGYRPLKWIIRLHFFAGQTQVRIFHTVIFSANPREVRISEIGLRIPFTSESQTHYSLGSESSRIENMKEGSYFLAHQRSNCEYVLDSFTVNGDQENVCHGKQLDGWLELSDDKKRVGVAIANIAEEYPKAFGVSNEGIDIFLWRSNDVESHLDYSRYSEDVAWHEGEGVYADGLGSAKTTEYSLCFSSKNTSTKKILSRSLRRPVVISELENGRCAPLLGNSVQFLEKYPKSERMLTGYIDWMARQITRENWYGYLDYGDILTTWDEESSTWKFRGRWGWSNSEWDPRHAVWLHFLRTGHVDSARLAEAMSRHSEDVDTCHFHPLRPYWVGGSFRHSMDHFGDEPCASHTFIDNWVDHYFLTGDGRAREVIEQAGNFFLKYRWIEDSRFSFSLRSIANVFRGLIYAYEVTNDRRYIDRAKEVFTVIVRAQNADGSWHKRFQITSDERLPDQLPYGMATEGATLATELGSTPPFTDDEFRALGPPYTSLIRELPHKELKGYQTHYLLIGLERFHKLTSLPDVADCYLRAVDWFCGGREVFDSEHALRHNYYGALCGSLAYAYSLSGDIRYVKVGRIILRCMHEEQDWSDDPCRRGSIAMNSMGLSLVFFGVPPLLDAMDKAGLEE